MKRHEFTILELLLVLGLSAALLTIAVPAFYRTMRDSATGSAARELMGKINAARAYAATNRTDVAIVFPRNELTHNEAYRISPVLRYRAYRVCEVTVTGSSITFKRWIPEENWTYLPAGVVIGVRNSGGTAVNDFFKIPNTADIKSADGDIVMPQITNVPIFLGNPSSTNWLDNILGNRNFADITNSIVIRMDGMLYNLQPVLIRLKQGTVNSAGNVTLTPPSQRQTEYLPVTVLFNGKVKLFRELVSE